MVRVPTVLEARQATARGYRIIALEGVIRETVPVRQITGRVAAIQAIVREGAIPGIALEGVIQEIVRAVVVDRASNRRGPVHPVRDLALAVRRGQRKPVQRRSKDQLRKAGQLLNRGQLLKPGLLRHDRRRLGPRRSRDQRSKTGLHVLPVVPQEGVRMAEGVDRINRAYPVTY